MRGGTTDKAEWRTRNKPKALFRAAVLSAVVGSLTLAAACARAAPYTFTLTGDLTGTIGGQTLTNDPFTWTVVGDANAPTTLGGLLPALPAISDVISLGGVGTAVPTVPTYVAQSQAGSAVGFISGIIGGQTPGIAWSAPALATATLAQPIGPQFATFNLGFPLSTTLGSLDVADATNLVFSASGGLPPPPDITYSLSGLLSGSLGATAFTDRPFTWTLTASTGALLTLPGPGIPALLASGDVLDIAGFGALTPNNPFFATGSAPQSAFGFIDQASGQGLSWTGDALASYVLGTPLGPLPVTLAGSQPIDTLGGRLTVSGATHLTLSAQLGAVPGTQLTRPTRGRDGRGGSDPRPAPCRLGRLTCELPQLAGLRPRSRENLAICATSDLAAPPRSRRWISTSPGQPR